MFHAEQMHEVRHLVERTFRRLGAGEEAQPLESILVRDGYYCGRRFDCDGMQAVWFIEENQIKFYGRDGTVQFVCEPSPVRQAPDRRWPDRPTSDRPTSDRQRDAYRSKVA